MLWAVDPTAPPSLSWEQRQAESGEQSQRVESERKSEGGDKDEDVCCFIKRGPDTLRSSLSSRLAIADL